VDSVGSERWAWLYPWIMVLAVTTTAIMLKLYQRNLALSRRDRLAIGIAAFCGAMLGAKLPFVFEDWEDLRSGLAWFSNGKTIVGGLVGAYLAVELCKWIYSIRVKTGDTFAVPIAVGIAIGRIGCFVAGCCYGKSTDAPWGVRFALADGGLSPRHPMQLYEAFFHASMAACMLLLLNQGVWRGQLVKFYIMAYLGFRWITEFLRPEPVWWLGMTTYQWFCLVMLPVFATLWRLDSKKMQTQSQMDFPNPIGPTNAYGGADQ